MNGSCKAFTGTSSPPLIICDESMTSSPFLTGTETFHDELGNLFKEKNDDDDKIQIHISTEPDKFREAMGRLAQARRKRKDVILIPGDLDYDELSMALGVALTGCNVKTVVCLSEKVLECYIQTVKALEIISFGVNVISCPTCGRCHQELEAVVKAVKDGTKHIKTPITIAIMGCEVNGPGEAKHADIGIASSKTGSILFKNGKKVKTLEKEDAAKTLITEAGKMCKS